MSDVIEKNNYVVVERTNYEDFLKSENCYKYSHVSYETDIFNKSSRTTVCFSGARDSKVMYCENCDETHYNHMGIEVELRDYSNNEEYKENPNELFFSRPNPLRVHVSKVICKKCGSSYNLEDIKILNHARYAHESDIRLVYDKIYNDDNLVKFSVKTCLMVVERGFYSVDNQYKVIFNTKTGQTYLYRNPNNKKQKIRIMPSKLTLENINFSAYEFDYVFRRSLVDSENPNEYKINRIKEMYQIIYEKISNNLGYNPKTLEEYAQEFDIANNNIYSFETLALFNRFPNLNPFGIINLKRSSTYPSIFKKLRAIKNTSKDPLLDLANAYNIKHYDLFKKYFYSDKSVNIYWLIYFSMFFDNKDYLEKISDKCRAHSVASNSYEVDELLKKRYSLDNSLSLFLKDIRKVVNEDDMYLLVKKLVDSCYMLHEIQKIAKLYYIIKKKNNCKVNLNMQLIYNLLCEVADDDDKGAIVKVSKSVQSYMHKELNKSAYTKNKKKFKFKLSTINEYRDLAESELNGDSIIVSNIYSFIPHFNPYVLGEILFGRKLRCNTDTQCDELENFDITNYIKDVKCDILGELFKEFNIPNVKSLRKKILKKPRLFKVLAFYSHLFSDTNLLNNILDSAVYTNFDFELSDIKKFLSEETDDSSKYLKLEQVYKITEQLIVTQGETIAAKKIAGAYNSNNCQCLVDIWPMYQAHLTLYPNEPVDLTGSLVEIHDRLVGLTGGLHRPFTSADFKPFKYSKKEKELNTDIHGYSFRLAYDGRELAMLGIDLKNCVRSYVERARKKDCFIVAVSYNSEYKICIELTIIDSNEGFDEERGYKYKLHQAKLYANTPVSRDEEALKAVSEWMIMNNIKDCSSDLKLRCTKKAIPTPQPEAGNMIRLNAEPAIEVQFGFEEFDDAIPF